MSEESFLEQRKKRLKDIKDGSSAYLKELLFIAHYTSKEKGWWDGERHQYNLSAERLASKICLMHSELSEALEEVREGRLDAWYQESGKPEGLPAELADVVIRIFDLCGAMNIDLEKAIVEKMIYNMGRAHKHGGKRI